MRDEEDLELDEEEIEEKEELTQEEEDLQGILAELGTARNVTMSLYRTGSGRKLAFLFSCQPSDYSLGELQERLRDEYDGGDFRIQVRKGSKLMVNQGLSVEAPKKLKEYEKPKENNNDIVALIATMNENSRQSSDDMRTLMMKQSQDNMNMVLKMMEIQAQNNNQKDSGPDMFTMLATFKELFGDKKEDPMNTFLKGLEFGKELGSGNEDILTTAVKTFGKPIADMVEHFNQASPIPAPAASRQQMKPQKPQQQIENKPAPNNAPENQAEGQDEVLLKLLELKPYINMLVVAASQDADIDTYANMVLDQVDNNTLYQVLNNNEYWDKFFIVVQPANQFRQWFEDLRVTVLDYLNQDSEDGDLDEENGHVSEQVKSSEDNNGEEISNASESLPGDDSTGNADTSA